MKALEALEKLYPKTTYMPYYTRSEKRAFCRIIEKELKALKFIKDTCKLKVYKNKLGQCFLEGTDVLYAISQEEYDLLKEVLLWKQYVWHY